MTFKATLAVLLISITGLAFAGASSCYSISNRDSKNFCLAVVGKQKSYCYNISSRDDKNACLARF